MDTKSLELLEFPKVRELIAGYASFQAGRDLALEVQPLRDAATIRGLLAQSDEARRLLQEDTSFSLGSITDVRETVKMAALGKVLEPTSLLEIERTLSATRLVRRNLDRHAPDFPRLWNLASGITDMPDLEKDINHCIAPGGEILDSASPQLGTVRRRQKKTRETLLSRLDATMRSAKGREIIQEPIITEREGRYVIPVKVEHRKDIRGIVHDMSNTGVTLFIEPWATLEMGNELRQLISEEKYEIERILRELSLKVAARSDGIARNVGLTAELDFIVARARYSLRARAVEPAVVALTDGAPALKLVNARHPLLGDKAVPLSLEIGRDFSILVITGPNMGGKTVALKTIGLLSAMALSGLPIPADAESVVPLFDGIYADIGDEQSIEQTVSTFSWHVSNIVRIIASSTGDGNLVLLDELGASTDPAEGSALARSIMLHLLSRRILTVATTHYDDLKAFAHTTPGLRNASLDLDPVTGAPTYHLTLGIPGGSNALAVAEHLGLPPDIIKAARDMMGKGTQELETLLGDLGRERAALAGARAELEDKRRSLTQMEAAIEARHSQVQAEERRLVETTRDTVVREAADLQRDLRLAAAELRKIRTREGLEQGKAALAAVQQRLKSDLWTTQIPQAPAEDAGIKAGDTVLLKDANLRATVVSVFPDTGQAEVQAGRARLTIGVAGLEKIADGPVVANPKFIPLTRQVNRPASFQIDLRGKRADEIEPALDNYLNSASVAGLSEVRVIHGMATGTVRKIVREFLTSHPLVSSFRPGGRGEGGDGATVVRL
jgi:DNA mismatch repair protein MutS2